MLEKNNETNHIISQDDALDINELAALDSDISPAMIEKLQSQIMNTVQNETDAKSKNTVSPQEAQDKAVKTEVKSSNIDDNFIKKYKAKLQKISDTPDTNPQETNENEQNNTSEEKKEEIAVLSEGNIVEKPVTQSQIDYSNNLDLLDDNTNYSKYVIYIEPENIEYIESLTVKERKNLINKVLREQGNIILSQKRIQSLKLMFVHIIVAILTLAIVVPVMYLIINASLEVSIDNYRRSKGLFQVLYQEHGKIKSVK